MGDAWNRPELISQNLRPTLAFAAITAVVAVSCLMLGPYPVTKFPEDTFYFLTQGDLLSRGYRPGIDYHSMHGPFTYVFITTAMYFHGVSLQSVVLAQVFGAILLGALMFKIASSRVSAFWSVLLAISVELILVSCTPTGSKSWREFTCAMWYNTIGYCIHAIIFLYLLAPSQRTSRIRIAVDDAIISFLIAASLLTKTSYFLPMAVVFVVGTIVLPRPPLTRTRGLVILAGGIAIAWAGMAALHGSLLGSFDLLNSLSMKVTPVTTSLRFVHYTRTIGLFLLGVGLIGWMANEAGVLRLLQREGILGLLMFGTLLASAGTSAQDQEMLPMIGVILLGLVVVIILLSRATHHAVNRYLLTVSLAIAFLLIVHEPKNALLSWAFSHMPMATTIGAPVERFNFSDVAEIDCSLADDVDRRSLTMMPKKWMSSQLRGVAMLKKAGVNHSDVVFVASDVSPINMLTGGKYPIGTIAWWPSPFIDVPEKCKSVENSLLEDTDYVLRESADDLYWRFLMFHRGDYFHENFELIDETADWSLYARKNKKNKDSK
jgi:hypothetical protein